MSPPARGGLHLETPVQYLKGVGPRRAQFLARLGISTIEDLLYHTPHDYFERSSLIPLSKVRIGERVTVEGYLVDLQSRRIRGGRTLVSGILEDGGVTLTLQWFNAAWVARDLRVGERLVVSGEVVLYRGRPQIVNPAYERFEDQGELREGRPEPRYPLTSGLRQRSLRQLIRRAWESVSQEIVDPLPQAWREEFDLMGLMDALHAVHEPASLDAARRGQRRLAFDEAFSLQLFVGVRRRQLSRRAARVRLHEVGDLSRRYVEELGFELTEAQRRALKTLWKDLGRPTAMHRLLQGDVGSGKTVVAMVAMVWIAESGAQAALMVPTEILARQHAARQLPKMERLGLKGALLTGSTPTAQRREILRGLKDGSLQIVIGTHALIQEGVEFSRLGLLVVDEQHRFGVAQRAALSQGGAHLIVMSATPIPRSLALTVFADLDLSILDEKPPGRRPVQTLLVDESRLEKVYARLRRRIEAGERAYLVYPLVEESEGGDLASATTSFEELRHGVLQGLKVGLLHGRMKATEKEAIRRDFQEGRLQVLVTTTVIEVGVDVPEATLMIVHHAERFGLAQLHQLRGRVGRGGDQSWCVLVAGRDASAGARRRLQLLVECDDGFRLAEEDLKERGMGELLGLRQHGDIPFRVLHPLRDAALVESARTLSERILEKDPHLRLPAHRALATWLDHLGTRHPFWSATG